MANGRAQLDEWLERLQTLPAELVQAATPEVAKELLEQTQRNAADGVSPTGEAWRPTKSGKEALPKAAQRVSVSTVGSVILLKLTGNEVRHHDGTARGHVRRQILPTRKVPDTMGRAIKAVLGKHFTRLVGG